MSSSPPAATGNFLPNVVASFGCLLCFFGARTFWTPEAFMYDAWQMNGIPTAQDTDQERLHQRRVFITLSRIYALRNFVLGALTVAIRLSGDRRLMGWSMIVGALEPLGDGLIQYCWNRTGIVKHWMFVPVSLGVGAGLLAGL